MITICSIYPALLCSPIPLIHLQQCVGMSDLIALLSRKSQSRSCPACGNLEPIDDVHIESPFKAVCAAAKKGCESCALLRHAIHDCLPEAIVSDAQSPVLIIVRRSILREFVEVAVRFAQPEKIVVLDLFVSPSASPLSDLYLFTC